MTAASAPATIATSMTKWHVRNILQGPRRLRTNIAAVVATVTAPTSTSDAARTTMATATAAPAAISLRVALRMP
eukprot:CAMPEP_0169249974 /NCGR_PEP_ID=MMETSP1016-20121227/36695_1 /TAXON_ID=342587 /ORGANISM="Karlodinium micrum, Strain CCMP2283" /LENGTH=73 /DNA_ID=CAMNT_0009330939 /DNA_START=579 /DNA_END=800 /DNA_ORIENTATION=+